MKKILMAAVALFCMTMTCVTLTSCGDDDSPSTVIECTLSAYLDMTDSGSLSEIDELDLGLLVYQLNTTQVRTTESKAKSELNDAANKLANDIKSNGWNASGAVYTIALSLQDMSGKTLASNRVVVNNGSVTVN